MSENPHDDGFEEVKAAVDDLAMSRKVSDVGIWQYIVEEDAPDRTVWDESLERLYGIEPGSFPGTHEAWMKFVHPEDVAKTDEEWWRAIEENRPFQMVYRIIRPDGEVRWVDSRALMLTDEDGTFERAVGMETDITNRLQQFQHLRVTDRFLRHDIRTALTIISLNAAELRDRAASSLSEYAENILEQSEALEESIEKHRELSKTLAAEAQPAAIDLRPAVERAVTTVREDHPSADITLQLEDDSVLETTVSAVGSFEAAIEEAIRNAVVHHDGDEPNVDIELLQRDEMVRLEIRDDGPGIPEIERRIAVGDQPIDQLNHLSGLGLWLISWTFEHSGGGMSIEDNEPRGSILVLDVPLAATP